ncbi:MAG: hypothetical protein LQ351_001736 [Letrouitia transgressa]|nr:MAG: hypothetical protein LQ351_001736 [Letrouitia transgressa]
MLPQELSSLRLDSSKPKLDSSTEAKDSSTFLRIEDAGAYLSYRPASRIGDDVVIWSLLTGTGNFDVAEELWLSPHTQTQPFGNRYLYTGFLISSAPRSTKQGLSWLPTTPYFKSSKMPMEDAHNPLRAFSAGNSMFGEFSEKGLKAYWLVYEFDTLDLTPLERTAQDTGGELKKITQRYLKGHRWGALLQARLNLSYFSANADNLAKYKGQIDGTPLAIVGSCNSTRPSKLPMEDGGWTWKGIYVWRKEVKLPDFQEVLDFFIE